MNGENIRKEERDNFTIVLESLQSDFKIFGESLDGVNDKLERVEKKVDMNFEEIGKIKIELSEMNGRLSNIEEEVKSLRKDFDLMREELEEKNMSFTKQFEERLSRVEEKLELSSV